MKNKRIAVDASWAAKKRTHTKQPVTCTRIKAQIDDRTLDGHQVRWSVMTEGQEVDATAVNVHLSSSHRWPESNNDTDSSPISSFHRSNSLPHYYSPRSFNYPPNTATRYVTISLSPSFNPFHVLQDRINQAKGERRRLDGARLHCSFGGVLCIYLRTRVIHECQVEKDICTQVRIISPKGGKVLFFITDKR